MKAIEHRIATLEAKMKRLEASPVGCAVWLKLGETFEQACKRLGITDGRFIVVGRPMTVDEFNKVAPEQQARLVAGDPLQ